MRTAMNVQNVKECEKMCYSEEKFKCSVFSFRYSDPSSNNCLLCDRSFSLLDSYADIVPDKDFDIYAMSDDIAVCKKEQAAPSRETPTYGHPNDRKMRFNFTFLFYFAFAAIKCSVLLLMRLI